MPRLTERTDFLCNFLDNVPLYAFSGFAPPVSLFAVSAILSTEVYAHTSGNTSTSLAPLPVASIPLPIPIVLATIPFVALPTPFPPGLIRFAISHTGLSTLGSLDKFVQSVLVSSSLFQFDRDIISVFFLFLNLFTNIFSQSQCIIFVLPKCLNPPAIAFAAQKTLEQFLGGIVLTLDRPFMVGDYIGLSDGQQGKQGTFGRVESIGLRSTKIRISGKGTLTVIPNNSLTQATIENFSGAKKIMSVMTITFPEQVSTDEQALIHQIVMDSTVDIFGLDWRSTEVAFGGNYAQISFFILGSNELSMDLRKQLLDLARQQITKQLTQKNISGSSGFRVKNV